MKLVSVLLSLLLLCSCASTSKVNDVQQQVIDGQATIADLGNKIISLEEDRKRLTTQLQLIDNNGTSLKSEATSLRSKISIIDQSINSYSSEIKTINSTLSKNSTNISAVKKQQKTQHDAAVIAVEDNQSLKDQAVDEIRALELEYEEKRRKAKEDQTENPDGK